MNHETMLFIDVPGDISLLQCSSSKSESPSSSSPLFVKGPPASGNFLFLIMILYFSWLGEGSKTSPSSNGLWTNLSPRMSCVKNQNQEESNFRSHIFRQFSVDDIVFLGPLILRISHLKNVCHFPLL